MKIKRPAPNIFLLISMFLILLVQKRLINLKKDCFAFVSINNLLKMRGIVLLILSLVFTNSVKAQNPYVEIVSPTPNQIVDSNLNIQVILTYNNQYYPNNQVAGITANVSGRVLSLTYNAQNMNYEGTLSIAGLVQDTLTLTVNVSDTQGDKDTVSLKFIYDLPPVLVVYEPMDFTVANPYLNIKAKCINKDSCTLNVSMGTSENSAYSNNFNDSTNTSIDLSLGEGNYGDLIFYATDKFGLTSQQIYRKIFVESSPYLTKVFEANDKIVDFNYNKVLVSTDDVGYSSHNNAINLSRIVDIQTGDSVNIPVTNYIREGFGNLTPFGAIFLGSTVYSIGDGDSIFDWNSGSLLPVDAVNSSYGILQTNGNYSIWLHSNQLMFRSLISKTNSIISFAGSSYSINTTMGSVLADGTVIYASNYNVANQQSFPYYNILKYKNGNTTVVSSDTTVDASRPYNEYDGSPSSDGNNILYDHYFLSYTDSVSNSLYLYNGKKDTLLSNLGNLFQGGLQIPHQQYQANNNFLVFPNVDSLGTTQLWMKDNLDNYYQITSVPPGQGPYSTVQLDLLNNKGDLIFSGYDLLQPYGLSVRYFETKKQIQEICSAEMGTTYYRDSSWYVAIGRNLFKMNVNIAPNTVHNSNVDVKKDSLVTLNTAQFASNFEGPGQLIYVMITSLPTNGTLELNGSPVALNAIIVRANLNQLSYVPKAGLTGTDSFGWNGSNGVNYTSSSATVELSINTTFPPPAPLLSTIDSIYCGNHGSQKVSINNMPEANSGINVQAKIDTKNLTVLSDNSFSFNTDSLKEGVHSISVIFSNSFGKDTATKYFTIIPPTIPKINVTASETFVTSNSSVSITATNISGGGNNPQYAFASDRAFINILQQSSNDNILTLQPSSFNIGDNWIYVMMKTSDSCYTNQTVVDSIKIIKNNNNSIGIIDPDFPNQVISANPNPFTGKFTITGLNISKNYVIILNNILGQQVLQKIISNQNTTDINTYFSAKNILELKLYDQRKNKLIGIIKLLSN